MRIYSGTGTYEIKSGTGTYEIKIEWSSIMTSVLSQFSQPVTRNFVMTNEGNGAYFYSEADINTWYAANASKVQKLGSTRYLITGTTSGSSFADVLLGNGGATELEHSLPNITDRKTIKDMGKEILFGDADDSRLLVLRKVQSYSPAAEGGPTDANYTGYVVVENNAENLGGNSGRFVVKVARI